MKRIGLLLLPVISFFFFSCEEDFSPFGEYHEKYSFTCILKSDTKSQIAFLSHSYRPNGHDPYENTIDPAIVGADIRVWYNDSVFVFRDTIVERIDTSRYKTPLHFYYNDQFGVQNYKTVELEVLLPNGKRLKSSSETPAVILFDDESEVIIPPVGKDLVQFLWGELGVGTMFISRLEIRYKQNINGEIFERTKEIPLRYVISNNEEVPVFPKPSQSTTIVYDLNAVAKALEEISAGDPDKQNYSVYQKVIFELVAFDLHASRYVSSISGSIDDLTVSESVSDYTNIEGGFGIFGSYSKKNYDRLKFLESYIQTFGYNFINEN
jgi:hypothetical protein